MMHDDIATFLYEVLKIKHEDCVDFDYTTGRYDSIQVQLKQNEPTLFLRRAWNLSTSWTTTSGNCGLTG